MARKGAKVFLGYEDESISDKHKSLINFTTNKIGGKPDWPYDDIPHPACKLCGLSLPLVVQIYAPLENSPHHRTLYLFGCVNPNCWNQNESWTCIRSQILEGSGERDVGSTMVNTPSATDWCCDAEDWEDDNNVNNNEENGNVIRDSETGCYADGNAVDDDDDEETESYEDDVRVQLGRLNVNECNANWEMGGGGGGGGEAVQEGGAVGRLHSPSATAEIEGEESEVVSIDPPTAPQHNLLALLQEAAPLPAEAQGQPPHFLPAFMSVGEEERAGAAATVTPVSEHVRDLLQEYQQRGPEEGHSPLHSPLHSPQEKGQGDGVVTEKYEKSVPAHGDRMFHQFISKIQQNPGQILRYGRETGAPLLLYPEPSPPSRCRHCRGELVFELQLLPTLLARLQLAGSAGAGHLEFGTVVLFTCRRSCWTAGERLRDEPVLVQAERL